MILKLLPIHQAASPRRAQRLELAPATGCPTAGERTRRNELEASWKRRAEMMESAVIPTAQLLVRNRDFLLRCKYNVLVEKRGDFTIYIAQSFLGTWLFSVCVSRHFF